MFEQCFNGFVRDQKKFLFIEFLSQCCLQLLRLAARVNTTNHEGQTALMIATHNNLDEMIKILLK